MSSKLRATLRRTATLMLMLQIGSAGAAPLEPGEAKQSPAEATRTGKERLGGKASDEQRVDNCKVPLALRGATSRPDECLDETSTKSAR